MIHVRKSMIFVTTVGLVLFGLFACGNNQADIGNAPIAEGPQMTIPDSLFDFGFAPQNSKITHIFWLHSSGTDTLRITRVVPG